MTGQRVQYHVHMADLISIADAACELDGMRQFYVDRPDEQRRIASIVAKLHELVERAAKDDVGVIYAQDDAVYV